MSSLRFCTRSSTATARRCASRPAARLVSAAAAAASSAARRTRSSRALSRRRASCSLRVSSWSDKRGARRPPPDDARRSSARARACSMVSTRPPSGFPHPTPGCRFGPRWQLAYRLTLSEHGEFVNGGDCAVSHRRPPPKYYPWLTQCRPSTRTRPHSIGPEHEQLLPGGQHYPERLVRRCSPEPSKIRNSKISVFPDFQKSLCRNSKIPAVYTVTFGIFRVLIFF